jgi:PAS domain S-box-containing protein
MVWHDKDGKIIDVNPYASEKLGYSPAELKGNYLYKFVVLNTRNHKQDEYYRQGDPRITRHRLFAKNGRVIPVMVSVFGAKLEEGDFGCAFFMDISGKVSLEDCIHKLEKQAGLQFKPDILKTKSMEDPLGGLFGDFIGKSMVIGRVFKLICSVAPTPTTVVIGGETGTGKELVAQKIHSLSDRAHKKLVKVNCATLPVHLIEGELFGHEKGAFTGAHTRKKGRFELADKGTIFLDEIGEMSLDLQAKLLRVLQEEEFERLGGTTTLKVDVRVVAATNHDLEERVEKGLFRQDLFFRLNVFPINLPPLRERLEDIPLLARFFSHNYCSRLNRKTKKIPQALIEKLKTHTWPGNVRELQNVVERLCILSTDDSLDPDFVSFGVRHEHCPALDHFPSFVENEQAYILNVLEKTQGKIFGKNGAAAIMGLNPRTLVSKIKKLGIVPCPARDEIQ